MLTNFLEAVKMKHGMRWILPLLLVLFGSGVCLAQSINAGDIRGSVTDASGALVPGVKVTVQNVDTGVTKDFFTNNDGVFDTSSIVNGSYKLTFVKQGFDKLVRGPLSIEVGYTTINAQLKIGQTTTEVTVTEDVALLHTETGDQVSTLESHDMDQMPNIGGGNGPDWQNFMILLPGATGAMTAGGNANAANPGQEVSTNGNLPYTNVLQDGASSTLPSSQNANPAAFEDVEELQVSTSSFSAQYGVGGLVINQITKGGTSKFHGTGYDYLQNATGNLFDANGHREYTNLVAGARPKHGFSLNAASYGFGNATKKQDTGAYAAYPAGLLTSGVSPLHYDDFGGTFSGPVKVLGLGKKAFFFFGYDQIINKAVNLDTNTVPSANAMAGNFTDGTAPYIIYNPATQTFAVDDLGKPYPVRTAFTNNQLTSFDPVSLNFQKLFPTAANHASYGSFIAGSQIASGVATGNYYAQVPAPYPWRRYFGRLDFDITPNNRLTMSDTQGDEIEDSNNQIAQCPVACQQGDVDNNNASVTDVWNISGRTINEARMGYTDQLNFFEDSSLGKNYPSTLGWTYDQGQNVLPTVTFSGTNPYYSLGPATNAEYKEFVFDPSDVVTMIRGKHILHFGGEMAFYRDDTTPWGNINAGQYTFNGAYTQQWTKTAANCPAGTASGKQCASANTSSGSNYADFLLGYASKWNAALTPEFGWRLKKPQMFVQDDWKVRPNLTVNLGFRYEISHGMNEVKGNYATFDPTVINVGVNNPAVSGVTNALGAYAYGSTAANGRTSLQANIFNTYLPRAGFAWAIKPNTTIRGGFGIYSYNWSQDQYGSGLGAAMAASGSLSDSSNGIYPITTFSGAGMTFPLGGGTAAALPFTLPSTDPTRFNGQGASFNYYHTPIPKIYQWNFGVERQLSANYAATLSYVASHGYNLEFPTDINTVPALQVSSTDTTGCSAKPAATCLRPYPIYQGIGGNLYQAVSNYNSLQATITKRLSHGLSFSFNYVWSHMLDDQDSSGWGSREGSQPYQYASTLTTNRAANNYGPSNFDVRSAFKGYVVYQLPFGKGMMFLNKNALADAVVGGWQISGTVIESTGNPFNVGGANSTYEGAGTQYLNLVPGFSKMAGYGHTGKCVTWSATNGCTNNWLNFAAVSTPGNGAFGTLGRNAFTGPGLNEVNLSGGKSFSLPWEGIKLAIRADASNALNHASFNTPAPGFTFAGGGAGGLGVSTKSEQINGVVVGGRTVQLGARLSF
jgi:hypothetical protein